MQPASFYLVPSRPLTPPSGWSNGHLRGGSFLHDLFHICNALLQDLLQYLGVLKLLLDLGDHSVGQFPLLAHLELTFISDPRVEDMLGLGGEGGSLRKLKGLSLEFGGFLINVSKLSLSSWASDSYFRHFKESLRDVHDIAERLHILNSRLDCFCVAFLRGVQNTLIRSVVAAAQSLYIGPPYLKIP